MKNRPRHRDNAGPPTAWTDSAEWYDRLVGDEGSEYQREVIFPGVLRMLDVRPDQRVIDVACGQGALCRVLQPRGAKVTGVDASRELIARARQRSDPAIQFVVGDARKLDFLPPRSFDAAACILAMQNIDDIRPVLDGISRALSPSGRLLTVIMHPCFRSPQHTSWGWDEANQVQYRRVERYLLPRKHPIVMHPGHKSGEYTWTFHRPISAYVKSMRTAGLLVDAMEEWPGHKTSTSGPRAAAENVARKEIPMFMALRGIKLGVEDTPHNSR